MRRLAFVGSNEFQVKLRHRVDEYFRETGQPRRDSLQLYAKAAVILLAFVFFYTLLVFLAETWWQAMPLSILLALVATGIGFNIMHDGGHGACSRYRFINRLMLDGKKIYTMTQAQSTPTRQLKATYIHGCPTPEK